MIEFKDLHRLAIVRNGPVVGEYAGTFVTEDIPQIGTCGKASMEIAFGARASGELLVEVLVKFFV